MIIKPRTAMIMAAGLGTRLRPITDHTPKPLVKVGGRPLIDYVIDRLVAGGVETIVCNLHYHRDQLRQHLEKINSARIVLVEEDPILESGGGVVNALAHLTEDVFYILNGDSLWIEKDVSLLQQLAEAWTDDMDFLLALLPVSQLKSDSRSDYFINGKGQLRYKKQDEKAPYIFNGVRLARRSIFEQCSLTHFSQKRLFDEAEEKNRLYGQVFDGTWINIDTLENLNQAEQLIRHHDV